MTACADPDQAAAARVAAIGGVTAVYASVEELLQHAEVDAVLVATSHDALYECTLAAIQADQHMLAPAASASTPCRQAGEPVPRWTAG